MGYDEHEMMIEYSEMTGFDFNSEAYREVKEVENAIQGVFAIFSKIWLAKTIQKGFFIMSSNNKRRYMDGCFCGDWVDVEVRDNTSEHLKHIAERKRKDLKPLSFQCHLLFVFPLKLINGHCFPSTSPHA